MKSLAISCVAALVLAPIAARAGTPGTPGVAAESRLTDAVSGSPTIQINSPSQPDNCSLPISAGYGSFGVGATIVWSHADLVCQAIRLNYALAARGYASAGVQVLCGLPSVQVAMKRAGTPCEAQTARPAK